MRFCGAQRNKKCLKSFKAFDPFGLKRKRKRKKIANFYRRQTSEILEKKIANIEHRIINFEVGISLKY
jgi:hypothetical protein